MCRNCRCKSYGFWSFVGDGLMLIFTAGWWLLAIIIREVRNGRCDRC